VLGVGNSMLFWPNLGIGNWEYGLVSKPEMRMEMKKKDYVERSHVKWLFS
jgi:hypothetical protein